MSKKEAIPIGIIFLATVAVWYWSSSSTISSLSNQSLQAQASTEKTSDSGTVTDSIGKDTSSRGTPEIFFPEKSYDFGTISQGSTVSHKFVVRNTGDAPLQLIKAKGS